MTDVKTLAEKARSIAAAAVPGSLERKAAGCCAVALSTTHSLKSARDVLADVRLDDVRTEALALLDTLTGRAVQEELTS